MNIVPALVILIGVVIGLIRIYFGLHLEPEPATWFNFYKDMAHIFIGGLGAAAWIKGKGWMWILFWFLCALEVCTAVMMRM